MVKPSKTVAPPIATKAGGKKKAIVSPTPTEDLEKSDTRMLKRGSSASSTACAPSKSSTKPKPSAAQSKSKSLAAKQKQKVVTVGHHDEINQYKTTAFARKKVPSSRCSLAASALPCRPPIISRYCGYCGDLLSTKAYGYDEKGGCDRRSRFHPAERIAQNQSEIQAAAETIKQKLLTGTGSQVKSSDVINTLNKRKNKKSKGTTTMGVHQEFTTGLPPWPEEALRMDETILEGLMSLKKTPINEVDCRCWKEQSRATCKRDLATVTASTLPAKTTKKPASKAGKTLVKKKVGTKTTTTTNTALGEITTTTVSITKCPKTGKRIKKTVRVVKKLVKKTKGSGISTNANKKSKQLVGTAGVTAKTAATAIKVGSSPSTPLPTNHSVIIPISNAPITDHQKDSKKKSPPSTGDKENSTPDVEGSGIKKRSREKQSPGSEEDDEHHSSDDDGSDDYGENCYNGPGISAKKRRRNDEKADLELRERLMHCPLEGGPVFPSQEELMELTTIRKRNALQTFYKRFNELRQFIAIFGDANVPQQFPENHSLGIWVNKMRMERKKWDTGSERTSLTERKIELLESIDFIWAQNHKGEIGWERRFQEIKKFKRKHGHCNVPTKSAENRALGRWVSTQRTMYKNYMKGFVGKSLTREEQERRIFLLLKEGFLFSMIPNGHEGGTDGGGNPTEENDVVLTVAMDDSAANDFAASLPTKSAPLDCITDAPAVQPFAGLNAKAPIAANDTAGTPPRLATSPSQEIKTTTTSAPTNVRDNDDSHDQAKTDPVPDCKESSAEEKKGETGDQNDNNLVASSSSLPQTNETVPKLGEHTAPSSPVDPVVSSVAEVSVTTTPTTTPSVSVTASPIRSTPERTSIEEDNHDPKENDKDNSDTSKSTEDVQNENKDSEMDPEIATSEDAKVGNTATSIVETNELVSSENRSSSQPEPPPLSEPLSQSKQNVAEKNSTKPEEVTAATTTRTTPMIEPSSSPSKTSIEDIPSSFRSESGPSKLKSEAEMPKTSEKPKDESTEKPEVSNNTKETLKPVSPLPFISPVPLVSSPVVLKVKDTGLTTTVSLRLKDKPIVKSQENSPPQIKEGEHHDTTTSEVEHDEVKLVTSDGLRIIVKMDDREKEPLQRTRSNSITQSSQRNDVGRSNSISALSPSRRSVRARKPSARQLEAEKSPLRESILGR